MRQALLLCVAALGVAATGATPFPVFGVVDRPLDIHLDTLRETFLPTVIEKLQVDNELAKKLIDAIGAETYERHLNNIEVRHLVEQPVLIMMRTKPEDVNSLTVYLVNDGISRLSENAVTLPILETLRTGDFYPIVFSPALLPVEKVLEGLHFDKASFIISDVKDISALSPLALRFAEIPWLVVQPKHLLEGFEELGLKKIGELEVDGNNVRVSSEMTPLLAEPEVPTTSVIMKVSRRSLGSTRNRREVTFLNWPSITLPTLPDLADIPAIVINFPFDVAQTILDSVRDRPPQSVTPIVHLPTVKPTEAPPAEAAKPEEPTPPPAA